ncbi:hypothetical protein C2S52_021760 [Perilla frutescens var. hirtella]|nr:hypothetical protein C2S52_021760 [Perilla frutescens var. hirtella]KAH6807811.1 hypothetical protein C2S51_028919 [Perilla frutescens var. frutescens]
MGRVNSQTPAAAPPSSTLKHFTHPHELHPLSVYNPQTLCSGCKLQSSGIMYTCTPCNFTLHQSCAKLPQLITHPSHGGCNLSLLTASTYPGGRFSCNACGHTDDSWNYHCARCEYDLHVSCASKPLKIRLQSHASCDLDLTFKNPYVNSKGFSCDICRKIGSGQWLYRCNSCEFDVHLDCTNAVPQPMLQHQRSAPPAVAGASHHHMSQLMHSASVGVGGGGMNAYGQFAAPPHAAAQVNSFVRPPQQPHLMHSASTGAIVPYGPMAGAAQNINQPARGGGLGGNIMVAALQGFVEGAFQGVGQAALQEVIGGGGGGDAGGGDMSSY